MNTKSTIKHIQNEVKPPNNKINVAPNAMDVSTKTSCRICKSCSGNDLIKSPCLCKGSLGYVHFSCLETWLNQACRDYCELCQYRFNAIRSRRYSLLRSLCIWVSNPIHRNYLCYDLAIMLILTALTTAIAIICLTGVGMFMREDGSLDDPFVRVVVIVFLFILITSYVTTLYLIVQDHVKPWYRWWQHCINVKLLIEHAHGSQQAPTKASIPHIVAGSSVPSREMASLEQTCSSSSLNTIMLVLTAMPRKASRELNQVNTETI